MKFLKHSKLFVSLIVILAMLAIFTVSAFAATTSVPQYKYRVYMKEGAWGSWEFQYNSYTYHNLTYDSGHGFYSTQESMGWIYWEEGALWWKKYYKAEKIAYWYFDGVTGEWLNSGW